eukprot:3461334-Rhodomonas_salina.2
MRYASAGLAAMLIPDIAYGSLSQYRTSRRADLDSDESVGVLLLISNRNHVQPAPRVLSQYRTARSRRVAA